MRYSIFITIEHWTNRFHYWGMFFWLGVKVEKILKGSLDLIPSPSDCSQSWTFEFLFIHIVFGKHCQQTFCPLHLKPTFLPKFSIFTEGYGIESRLSSKIFLTLLNNKFLFLTKDWIISLPENIFLVWQNITS